jgi:glycosyltransferase involved in cell wall biosynthesis
MDRLDIIVLMPVYRDWAAASAVCRLLDGVLASSPFPLRTTVLLIDDGSDDELAGWRPFTPDSIAEISVLRLRANVGHQRAICAGLCHVHEMMKCDYVVVMDADGEDRAEDVLKLLAKAQQSSKAVWFAARQKRMTGRIFRLGYRGYQLVHRALTGIAVTVGNFSILRYSVLSRLVTMPELWNHYAGAVFKSRVRFGSLPLDRGKRLAGNPQMNVASLVMHGLSGIASFQELVTVRILIGTVGLLAVLIGSIALVIGLHALGVISQTLPAKGVLVVLWLTTIQLLGFCFTLVFLVISRRTQRLFIPYCDYKQFVAEILPVAALQESRAVTGQSK